MIEEMIQLIMFVKQPCKRLTKMGKKLIKMENTVIVEKFQKAAGEGLRGI